MALTDQFSSMFSAGKYSICSSLCKRSSDKGDNLCNEWINSCNLATSQFMSIYLEDNVMKEKKSERYVSMVTDLQKTINQIRSVPVSENLLQIELSALYNLLYIQSFTEDSTQQLPWIHNDIQCLMEETLVRVIYRQSWRRCSVTQDTDELLMRALQQTSEELTLSALVSVCCLWMVLKCRHDELHSGTTVMDECIALQKLDKLESSPLIQLPLPVLLTGNQYTEGNPSISDLVYLTAGMVYYKTDGHKSRDYLKQVLSSDLKPYTYYLIASLDYNDGQYVEVLTTLSNIPHDISLTDRIKSLHCHLFGMTLSKLDTHHCAIQKYREALERDFSFLLPLYMISLEYRSLNMISAELESLNLMINALEKSVNTQCTDQSLFSMFIEETCGQLTLCQVLYTLASRCSQLKMYDDSAQRYLDLLTYLHDNCFIQISGNKLVEIPDVCDIYLEAVCILHHARKYNECIAVCDQILNCLPSNSQNESNSLHTQLHDEWMPFDKDENIIDFIGESSEDILPQESNKRKRQKSEESGYGGSTKTDIVVQLYKADSFVSLGKIDDSLQCLDRCCQRLPSSSDFGKEANFHHPSKRQRINSDSETGLQNEKSNTKNDVQRFAGSVYCHVGIAVATKGQIKDALHFLRLGLRLDAGNVDILYNYVVVLWSVNKREAVVSWCQGRNIEIASDRFHISSILKQKQNKLRSVTGLDFFRETDIVPTKTVTDESILKLDILCLNSILSKKQ